MHAGKHQYDLLGLPLQVQRGVGAQSKGVQIDSAQKLLTPDLLSIGNTPLVPTQRFLQRQPLALDFSHPPLGRLLSEFPRFQQWLQSEDEARHGLDL